MPIEKDPIEELFDRLNNTFDLEEPERGHKSRFLEKLERSGAGTKDKITTKNKGWYWKPLSIAASIVILIAIGVTTLNNPSPAANPEIEKTQFYFASLLNEEIEKLNTIADEDTKVLVQDVMQQLSKLQDDYELLEKELAAHGDHKKILYAMVTNFQTRINLLQEVIDQIEETKKLKTLNANSYEDISI
ncbi:hypothetical protein ACJD0Z_11010 [Flavobacteriaceae bacterium M23B6Z8]